MSKQAATEEKKMLDRVDKELCTTKEAGYLVKVNNQLFMSNTSMPNTEKSIKQKMSIDKNVDHCRNQAGKIIMKQIVQVLVNMTPHLMMVWTKVNV